MAEFHITIQQYDKDCAGGWFDDVNILAQDVSIPEVLRRLADCWEAYVGSFGYPVVEKRPLTREDVKRAVEETRRELRENRIPQDDCDSPFLRALREAPKTPPDPDEEEAVLEARRAKP